MMYLSSNSICIQQYDALQSIDSKKIIIQNKNVEYEIYVDDLFVFYLSKDEIKIIGKIKEVHFNE